MMNGPLSQSLREKGVGHRVIFGVELPRLQSFSEEIEHSYTLALALWHENIRECRLLATMIMPHNALTADEADTWAEEIKGSFDPVGFIPTPKKPTNVSNLSKKETLEPKNVFGRLSPAPAGL